MKTEMLMRFEVKIHLAYLNAFICIFIIQCVVIFLFEVKTIPSRTTRDHHNLFLVFQPLLSKPGLFPVFQRNSENVAVRNFNQESQQVSVQLKGT